MEQPLSPTPDAIEEQALSPTPDSIKEQAGQQWQPQLLARYLKEHSLAEAVNDIFFTDIDIA